MDSHVTAPASTRELIVALTEVEDALRGVPTFVSGPDGSARLSLELLALLDREAEIRAALRGSAP